MSAAFESAEFGEASAIFVEAVKNGARPDIGTTLLQGRTLLKLDADKAVPFLLKNHAREASGAVRGRWHLYLAIGFARLREFAQADEHFAAAEREFKGRREGLAEISYQRVRRYLLEQDIPRAWRFWDEAAKDPSRLGAIRAEQLRSFIYAFEENYVEQARCVLKVLDLIGTDRRSAIEEWCTSVHTASVLARELSMKDLWVRAEAEVNADVQWPEFYSAAKFQAFKAVGWCRALQGDGLGCFRYLRAAQLAAPSAAYSVIVLLDRAYFAGTLGEERWAANELASAEELAGGVDWDATTEDERVGLLLLAQLSAPLDSTRAAYYLARFKNLGRLRSNLHHFAFDRRLDAIAAYSAGVVKSVEGDAEQALEQFRSAWATFDRIRYDWRAGQTAIQLFRLTQKNRWRLLAEEKLELYRFSWLIRGFGSGAGDPAHSVPALTPMQDRIFRLICQGRTTQQICTELGRADNTVRNHVKAIFKAFGVNTRASLVAEAVRRGLVR